MKNIIPHYEKALKEEKCEDKLQLFVLKDVDQPNLTHFLMEKNTSLTQLKT